MATSLASGLPSDILRLIFEILNQPDVLACAAVCREWRATAVLDRSYYRALTLLFPTLEQKPPVVDQQQARDTSLSILLRASLDAEQFQYNISLTVEVRIDYMPLLKEDNISLASQKYDAAVHQIEKELVSALHRAMPRLIRLDVQVALDCAYWLLPAFTVPAPLLRIFKFIVSGRRHDGERDSLPRDLFSGHAPHLAEVSLARVELRAPAPCFANVRRLHLDSVPTRAQLVEVLSCFPRVRHFAIYRLQTSMKGRPESTGREETAFFGRLRSLYIGHDVSCSAMAPFMHSIAKIPHVQLCAAGKVYKLAEVLGVPTPDEMILSEHVEQDRRGFSHLRAHLSATSATRVMDSCVEYDVTLRTLRLSSAALSLTKVSVDDRHLRSLVQACPSMPLLEYLIVTLIAWSVAVPWEADKEIDCACPVHPYFALDTRPPDETLAVDYPRLRTLELRATHAHATVRAGVLPALARCFAPLDLVLSNGIALNPGAPESVAEAFSSIRRGSPEEFVQSADTARVAVLLETAARSSERMHIYQCPRLSRPS